MPKIGKDVETPDGFGTVVDLNVLKETVSVRVHNDDSNEVNTYSLDDVVWFKMDKDAGKRTKGKGKAAVHAAAPETRKADDEETVSTEDEAPENVEAEEYPFVADDEQYKQEPLTDEIEPSGTAAKNWQEEVAQALRKSDSGKS